MLGLEKLELTKDILEQELGSSITDSVFNALLVRIRVTLRDGSVIIVYFNDHDQYSYSILFSTQEEDRCRFDNFDKDWVVKTAPHHYHPREMLDGFDSPMIGDPSVDIPFLCNLIKDNTLFDAGYRF
jgi:hypothetical protein